MKKSRRKWKKETIREKIKKNRKKISISEKIVREREDLIIYGLVLIPRREMLVRKIRLSLGILFFLHVIENNYCTTDDICPFVHDSQ